MKVLQINSVCGIRSTGRICTDIAELLEKQGHTCRIAYGRENVPRKYQKYAHPITTAWNNRIDALKSRIFDNAGFNSTRITRRFVQWMKEFDPDIIHLHNLHGYYINVEILFQALKEMQKPVIWTLHDCWAFTGHCPHFELVDCQKWKSGCFECPLTKSYPVSFSYDRSGRNYCDKKSAFTGVKNMTIVTPSKWLANYVRQSFLGEYEVKVIHNGVDLNVFKPTTGDFREIYKIGDKKIVLGVASAWGKNKGLYDLYKLAERLGNDYQVVVVGLKQGQMKELPSNIIGITRTDNVQQLAHIYTTADIFVNPTYQDSYPTVNLEAQACGTPVITYRTGGSVESVPEKQIVDKGDLDALCEAIKDMNEYSVTEENDLDAKEYYKRYIDLYYKQCVKNMQNTRSCLPVI